MELRFGNQFGTHLSHVLQHHLCNKAYILVYKEKYITARML